MGSASHARRLGASARARLGDASRGAWVDTCADSPPHVMGLVAGLGLLCLSTAYSDFLEGTASRASSVLLS